MFKLSACFVALLAGIASATPVIEARGGPPEAGDACRPVLNTTIQYFLQSSGLPNKVWEAQQVEASSFITAALVNKTTSPPGTQARDNQLWSIQPVNNGNSAAIVSAGTPASACVNGDGGPVDSFPCSDIFATNQVAQSAQWFIFCQSCTDQSATSCQIQSANEGQCASFLDEANNVIKLDDCSSSQPHQFWDIVFCP